MKCGVRSVKCEECSVKCGVLSATFGARTHGPGWRKAHASSIDEKGLIV